MPLDPRLTYRRTERGLREVYEKSYQFTQSERLILILVDGRLDLAGLKSRLPSVSDERLGRALAKLVDAGLIEQTRTAAPHAASLQPDAVAQFLEQTELDPVTVIGGAAGGGASRAEELAFETAMSPAWNAPASSARASPDNRRRASERSQGGRGEWGAPATDFAITTVNVPDRLDMQEMRAREDEDEIRPRRSILPDSYAVGVWIKRLVLVGIVGGLGYFAFERAQPALAQLEAPRIAERLSRALGQPVTVAGVQWKLLPRPRVAVVGVRLPNGVVIDEVALHVNWRDVYAAAKSGQIVWGEAAIPVLKLSSEQALGAIDLLARSSAAVPATISALRFESVQFNDAPLLPGAYEVLMRRGPSGSFGGIQLSEAGKQGTGMRMRLNLSPGDSGNPGLDFQLDATMWQAPIGPQVEWADVIATGRLERSLVLVDTFTAGGFYGVVQGALAAGRDLEWATTGVVRASNIDLESVFQSLARRPGDEASAPVRRAAMNGTAVFDLQASGRGETLHEAIRSGALEGPAQVRFGILNGINLGYVATKGGGTRSSAGGGLTRFTELTAGVMATSSHIELKDVIGKAGAMSTRGELMIGPDLTLTGALRVDLGATRVQAPLNLRVRGSVLEPQFGR